MAHKGLLPQVQRYITTHNHEGQAIFSDLDSQTQMNPLPSNDAAFALGYATQGFPINLTSDNDLDTYKSHLITPPGLSNSNGSVLRVVDMMPGLHSAMHRTVSLDYGVVLEGEVELVLDSGETRLLKRGDIAVQRGTNHAWKNVSQSQWARMLYVLLPAKPIEIDGKPLGEDLGTMQGVRKSD